MTERPPIDAVSIAEIAEMLQVNPGTVSKWRRRGLLPEPDRRLAAADLWHSATIWEWAISTGRMP